MFGEMVQTSQIQYSFTFNDFIFVHGDIHSHEGFLFTVAGFAYCFPVGEFYLRVVLS